MITVTRTKSLPADENAAYRARLRALIASQYGGIEANAVGDLGISQGYLNQFLNAEKGAGVKMVKAIERLEAKSGIDPAPNGRRIQVELPVDSYRPATDPISDDWAMRWRALQELVKQGRDPSAAFGILSAMQFDEEQRPPTWGDYFSKAIDELDGVKTEAVEPKQLRPVPRGRRH